MKLVFAWYDFWVGLYYDRKNRRLYFFPIPMIGIMYQFGNKNGHLQDIFANHSLDLTRNNPRKSA